LLLTPHVLHAVGCVDGADREDVVQAVLHREGLGTTGVGDGVAFPEALLWLVAIAAAFLAGVRYGEYRAGPLVTWTVGRE
jgi:mannitol/fructose-specific phosphotransferase system IIA component